MQSRIKALAEAQDLSLWKLASMAELTSSALYKWERVGLEKAQLGALVKVSKVLGCSIEELYED